MDGMQKSEIAEVLNRPLSQELLNRPFMRLAYVGKDGTQRVIPIAFVWNGAEVVVVTPPNAPKLVSLRANPAVALTIDTEEFLPKILLIRGQPTSTTSKASPTSTSRPTPCRPTSSTRGRRRSVRLTRTGWSAS